MRTPILLVAVAVAGLVGCGQGSATEAPTTTVQATATTQPVAVATSTTVPPTTAAPTTSPTTTRPLPTTARLATTATTRPLTRAEATSRLCTAVQQGDEAVQSGSFVKGGLRLGGGISANEKAADPAVLAAARAMLKAGVGGDVEGYATARKAASTACTRAGYPIQLAGPVQCITTPCP